MAHPADLHLLPAHKVVALLRGGSVTPSQLIDIVEARIADTDSVLRATPTTCFKRARKAAAAFVVPADPPAGFLYGLPVLVKDVTPVEGVLFTVGSPIFRERVAKSSHPLVRALEARGAIVVGKTNTPEFGAGSQTFNPVFGTTVSPWDARTTAGGSSGGAAAALAGCQCWLAAGSDLGGSLRTPAAFCGVVGFRVSPGLVARDGPSGPRLRLQQIDGPMGRCVRDVGLFLDAMAGTHGWEFPHPLPLPAGDTWEAVTQRGAGTPRRVGFSTLGIAVDPAVEALCRRGAELLAASAGHGALEVGRPFDTAMADRLFHLHRAVMFAGLGDLMKGKRPEMMKPELRWNASMGVLDEVVSAAEATLREGGDCHELAAQIEDLFRSVDILCVPTTQCAAFDASIRYLTQLGGEDFSNYLEWMRPAYLLSVTGCPVLSLPCGFLADGRPVGLQLVGPPGGDAAVLQAAALLEAKLALPCTCPVPIRGSSSLQGAGPTTAQAAEEHHAAAAGRFVARYARKSRL